MRNVAERVTVLTSSGLAEGVVLMEVQRDDPRVGELSKKNVLFVLIGRTRDTTGIPFGDLAFEAATENFVDRLVQLEHTDLVLNDGGIGNQLLGGYGGYNKPVTAFHTTSPSWPSRHHRTQQGRPILKCLYSFLQQMSMGGWA